MSSCQPNGYGRRTLVVALGPEEACRRRLLSLTGLIAFCKTTKLRGANPRLIAAGGIATATASTITFDDRRHASERVAGDRQRECENEQPSNHQWAKSITVALEGQLFRLD
jgi:hypothetical protein